MKNQREIIRNVRSMSVHELLDLVVYSPFFLTDAYYVEIGKAVRSRYAELIELSALRASPLTVATMR